MKRIKTKIWQWAGSGWQWTGSNWHKMIKAMKRVCPKWWKQIGLPIFSVFTMGLAVLILTACAATEEKKQDQLQQSKKQYQATFLDVFDTVTTIVGYADSEESFQKDVQVFHDTLEEYHQLFDIYNDYEGINNIKTINEQAGIAPVKADQRIIEFLLDCREYYKATDGKVNVAMGSVLSLWHEARDSGVNDPANAQLPELDKLEEAAKHINFDTILINEAESTVYISDPQQQLDVGAIAKGWSVEKVCQQMASGFLVSVGGNVCATGPKPENNASWVVGIQSPDFLYGSASEEENDKTGNQSTQPTSEKTASEKKQYLHTLNLEKGSVVTSGDYQRYYTVDGKRYHHIIDPDTLFPAEYWRSVSVVCNDSGLADALSTALFLMSAEEGQVLLDQYNACAMWVDSNGRIFYSTGFEDLIRN